MFFNYLLLSILNAVVLAINMLGLFLSMITRSWNSYTIIIVIYLT